MKALFVHIYYSHLWDEIVDRLKNVSFQYNLYLNLVQGHTENLNWKEHFPSAVVLVSPNNGMDCGAQLRQLKNWLEHGQNEEFIVFLHSKGKPLGTPDWKVQETFALRDLMWSIVTPEKYPKVEQAFLQEDVGMVGVKEWHLYPPLEHGAPIPECQHYCDLLHLNNYQKNSFGFIGGTMFFVRSKIFKKVFGSIDIIKLVEELPPASNGGLIHALERIFGYIVLSENYKIKGI